MPAEASLDAAKDAVRAAITGLSSQLAGAERALAELEGTEPKKPRGPGRPRGSSKGRKRRRRKNTRLDQAVEMVEKKPGLAAKDIAKAMKIKPNYLYRVLDEAVKEKRLRKDGMKYYPA